MIDDTVARFLLNVSRIFIAATNLCTNCAEKVIDHMEAVEEEEKKDGRNE